MSPFIYFYCLVDQKWCVLIHGVDEFDFHCRRICVKVDRDSGDKSKTLTMLTFAFLSIAAKWMKIDLWQSPAAAQPKSSTFIHRKGGLPKALMQTWLFGTQTLPGKSIFENLHLRIKMFKSVYNAFDSRIFTQHLVTLRKSWSSVKSSRLTFIILVTTNLYC